MNRPSFSSAFKFNYETGMQESSNNGEENDDE